MRYGELSLSLKILPKTIIFVPKNFNTDTRPALQTLSVKLIFRAEMIIVLKISSGKMCYAYLNCNELILTGRFAAGHRSDMLVILVI